MAKFKSAASKAASKVMKTAITKNHRKYVLNNFSIVEKARILILQTKNILMTNFNDTFELIYDLSVQVNPSHLEFNHSISAYSALSGLKSGSKNMAFPKISFGPNNYQGNVSIPLIFDIYDEYNARSADGALPVEFSLDDEKATALPTLIRCVEDSGFYVKFIWGPMEHFGFLSGINVNYTAFSQWGQPLKAETDLSITPQPMPDGLEVNINENISSKTTVKKIVNGIKNLFR